MGLTAPTVAGSPDGAPRLHPSDIADGDLAAALRYADDEMDTVQSLIDPIIRGKLRGPKFVEAKVTDLLTVTCIASSLQQFIRQMLAPAAEPRAGVRDESAETRELVWNAFRDGYLMGDRDHRSAGALHPAILERNASAEAHEYIANHLTPAPRAVSSPTGEQP